MSMCGYLGGRTLSLSLSLSLSGFVDFLKANLVKVISLVIAYVLLLSVIGAQYVPYSDDTHRRVTGSTGFGGHDGRWGSELVAILLHQNTSVVDLGLTTFVLSAVILALASCLMIYAVVGRAANWLTFALALLIGLNPWYLNAAAFRFDGPFFALSILFSACTILLASAPLLIMFMGYTGLIFITANFFQPMLGVSLMLLLTVFLMAWLNRQVSNRQALSRIGVGVGGVVLGALLYLGQTLVIVPGRGDIALESSNPIRALARNTIALVSQFLADSSITWAILYALLVLLFLVFAVRISRHSWWFTIIVIGGYLGLLLLAAGNVLLLANTNHITTNARFMSPLAMGLTILAMIVSGVICSTPQAILRNVVLIALLYVWLAIVFVFALVLREQQDSFRFQAQAVVADLFTEYLPGDTIYYDSRIFSNSRYLNSVAQHFPIFSSPLYADPLNISSGTARFRFAELLGLSHEQVVPINVEDLKQNQCLNPISTVIQRPRWEVFRAAERTVCITFPTYFIAVAAGREGAQAVQFDFSRFPYDAGRDNLRLTLGGIKMAIWSLHNPADLQWAYPLALENGVAQFRISAPSGGWTDNEIVAHLYLNDGFLYQHIWLLEPGN